MTTEFRAKAASLACDAAEGAFLPELPPSRWRSLGKRMDYAYWPDRDRFVELDAAIMASKEQQGIDNSHSAEGESEQPARTEDTNAHLHSDGVEFVLKQLASPYHVHPAA